MEDNKLVGHDTHLSEPVYKLECEPDPYLFLNHEYQQRSL